MAPDMSSAEKGQVAPEEMFEDAPPSFNVGKAEWYEVGYTMTTAVAGPALLGLPFAMSLLGWVGGTVALLAGWATTLYTSYIVASLHDWDGRRHVRYRDLAESIFGKWWGRGLIWPCQWANLIGGNISIFIQAGLSMQLIYQTYDQGSTGIKLWEFIAIMAAFAMVATQLPTLHSLRLINGVCMLTTYAFTFISIGLAVYQHQHYPSCGATLSPPGCRPTPVYTMHTGPGYRTASKIFGIFNGIVIMSFAYGNTIIPEIQSTAKHPANRTMYKAIGMLYVLLTCTYLPMAFVGYWAYGQGLLLNGGSYLPQYMGLVGGPKGPIVVVACINLVSVVCGLTLYNAPVLEIVETYIYSKQNTRDVWQPKVWFLRTVVRCIYIFLLAFIAALFPYFGDILGLIGALGITPVDFVYPIAMYIAVRKPRGLWAVVNWGIAILYTIVGLMGTIAAIRGIALDVKIYSAFANLGVAK